MLGNKKDRKIAITNTNTKAKNRGIIFKLISIFETV
jgi:hypothetical protein